MATPPRVDPAGVESSSGPPPGSAPETGGVAVSTKAPPPRRTRARRVGLLVGIGLVLAGIGMLGFVAWEFVGTNIISRRTHAELRAELREQWQQPTVGDIRGPELAAAQGTATALIRIPRFGDDYEIPMIEGVGNPELARGIGHFQGAGPGQIGNFALAAHRGTHGYPFSDLDILRPGDEVIVETSDTTYTYELLTDPDDLVVPFTQTWVVDPVPIPPDGEGPRRMPLAGDSESPTQRLITLTTCAETFSTDDRMVAFGHLVTSTPK